MSRRRRLRFLAIAALFVAVVGYLVWPYVAQGETGALRFCHAAHYSGVLASSWVTVLIYHFADRSGWYERIDGPSRDYMQAPFMLISVTATIFAVLSIANLRTHLIALHLFFWIFAVWDLLLWMSPKKQPRDIIARRCEEKARHWFLFIDFPTPLLFWLAYLVSENALMDLKTQDGSHAHELVMSGVIAAVLFSTVWEWVVDCAWSRWG